MSSLKTNQIQKSNIRFLSSPDNDDNDDVIVTPLSIDILFNSYKVVDI